MKDMILTNSYQCLIFLILLSVEQHFVHSELCAINEIQENYNLSDFINHGHLSRRTKRWRRETDPQFKGHPKTREEMWYHNFNIGAINEQTLFAERLVLLLNKVANKYLRSCVSIVIYDEYVEQTDAIILQTFFQVKLL